MTERDRSGALVYVDKSEVREGALEALKEAISELVDFIETNVPRVITYNVYLSEDGTEMTVIHAHRDSASLDRHLEAGGPAFRKFVDLLTLKSIEVYGSPSEKAMEQLHDKARLLGNATVTVIPLEAGFARFGGLRE